MKTTSNICAAVFIGGACALACAVAADAAEPQSGPEAVAGQDDRAQSAFHIDIVIEGDGYLQATNEDGEVLYTRSSNICLNENSQLVVGDAAAGHLLSPAISIPSNAISVTVDDEGNVRIEEPSITTQVDVGQIQLARFDNPRGLQKIGENMFRQTDASGQPSQGCPGTNGLGKIRPVQCKLTTPITAANP